MAVASVDEWLRQAKHWNEELSQLIAILRRSHLDETIKWNSPCYCYGGQNVVGVGAFKGYFGLWFYQGVMLSDPLGVLINAQAGKTRAMRQWRMSDAAEIDAKPILAYVEEAAQIARDGRAIKPERNGALEVPAELAAALGSDAALAAAFDALTPGRQREYANHVGEAKRAETRSKRAAKVAPMIRAGKGLNDRYRNC